MDCHQPPHVWKEQQNNFTYALIDKCGVSMFYYIKGQFNGNNFTCDCKLFQEQYHNLNNLLKVQTRQNHFLYVGGLPILMLPFFFKKEIEILYLSYQMKLKSKYLHLFTGSEVEHQLQALPSCLVVSSTEQVDFSRVVERWSLVFLALIFWFLFSSSSLHLEILLSVGSVTRPHVQRVFQPKHAES